MSGAGPPHTWHAYALLKTVDARARLAVHFFEGSGDAHGSCLDSLVDTETVLYEPPALVDCVSANLDSDLAATRQVFLL